MKKLFFTTALLITALFFTSCSSDDDNNILPTPVPTPEPLSIVEFITSNSNYSSLASALVAADLVSVFDGSNEFTVFAPNNASFEAFLAANSFDSLEDVPLDLLTQVLLNHVITGKVMSTDLSTGYFKTNATFSDTSNNLDMFIDLTSGVKINGSTYVNSADIVTTDGVIHAVDAVIGLPSVVTFATADSTFDTLVASLTSDVSFTYVQTLSTPNGTTPAPFTVFAPTNAAFGDLLTELGATGLSDIPTATLKATLDTHVVTDANVTSGDLSIGANPISTSGDDFTINVSSDGVTFTDLNGREGNIVVTDVQAANGVIHVVDTVILPAL
jgi:uncharacterized surface protein with fasciclin (FAS1) repeats